jgi:hypothetical protein
MASLRFGSLLSLLIACPAFSSPCSHVMASFNASGVRIRSAEENTLNYKALERRYDAHVSQEVADQVIAITGRRAPLEVDRMFVYVEDNQGYSVSSIAFTTNYSGAPGKMSLVSWVREGAGRVSTSFFEFCGFLKAAGYSCGFVRAYETDFVPTQYRIVRGATGSIKYSTGSLQADEDAGATEVAKAVKEYPATVD